MQQLLLRVPFPLFSLLDYILMTVEHRTGPSTIVSLPLVHLLSYLLECFLVPSHLVFTASFMNKI